MYLSAKLINNKECLFFTIKIGRIFHTVDGLNFGFLKIEFLLHVYIYSGWTTHMNLSRVCFLRTIKQQTVIYM